MQLLQWIFVSALLLIPALQQTGAKASGTVVVFRGNSTVVPYLEEDSKTVINRHPLAFRVPAFVGGVFSGKEFLVALCDARYNGWSDWDSIEIAAKTSYGDYTKWGDAKIIVRNTRKNRKSIAGDATAVMKGDKVYALVISWDDSPYAWIFHAKDEGWNPLMYTGTVTQEADSKDFFVKWAGPVSLRYLLPSSVNGAPGKQFVGGVGNGVVMSDGTIVLPIQIGNVRGRLMASIIYSQDDGVTWKMGGFTSAAPTEASVIEWGTGTLLMSTRVDGRPRMMFQSTNMGKTWTEFTSLSGVWGNQPNRGGPGCQASLIKLDVEGTDVMLFSHPLNSKGGYTRDRLQLWMTNGHRIFLVGDISKEGEGDRSGYAILAHVGENVYCMHEVNPFDMKQQNPPLVGWDRTLALSKLTHMMNTVKKTVRSWNTLDTELERAGVPTNGLIGHLSDSVSNTTWIDAYGCVDAVVRGAQKVDGGFQFLSKSGQARWPVNAQGQNQRYFSTRWAFTLAATVSIDSLAKNDENTVLGASLYGNDRSVFLALGYTSDNKWTVLRSGSRKITSLVSFELDKAYHVALTFSQSIASVWVNGVTVYKARMDAERAEITHFFVGGREQQSDGSLITATHVMLYNRALNNDEINALQKDLRTTLSPITKRQTSTVAPKAHNTEAAFAISKDGAEIEFAFSWKLYLFFVFVFGYFCF